MAIAASPRTEFAFGTREIAMLLAAGAFFWFIAVLFIHHMGPRGWFGGWRLVVTYVGSIPVAWSTIRFCRRMLA